MSVSLNRLLSRMPRWLVRFYINHWRPLWGCGVHIDSISNDYRLIKVALPLRWYNKNFVGVHFGGSLFLMTDAFYMVMLTINLGTDYIVWDKSAKIDFKKPGRGTVRATFHFTDEEINDVRSKADSLEKYVFDKLVDIIDEQGDVVASVVKTLYVRRKK